MPWVMAGASLVGSLISSSGARDAANTQADAQNRAAALQKQMFDTQRQDLQPFREAGAGAAGVLGADVTGSRSITGGVNQNDINQFLNPGAQFAMDWGTRATTNLANTSGGAFSGNTLKAISDYTTGSALNQFYTPAMNAAMQNKQNIYGNLMGVANMGEAAASNSATGGSTYAQNIGTNIAGAGASQAGGQVAGANAFTGGVNNAASWYALNNMMKPSSKGLGPMGDY